MQDSLSNKLLCMTLIGVSPFYFYLGNSAAYRGGTGTRAGPQGELPPRGGGGHGNRRLRTPRHPERCVYKRYKITSDNSNG